MMMTVMISSFAGTFLLLHLGSTVSGLGSVVTRSYLYKRKHYTWQEAQNCCRGINSADCKEYFFFICGLGKFIPESKTWDEASEYYRENYHSLTRFVSESDIDSQVHAEDFPVWIGLHRDGEMWKWSAGRSEYRNWTSGEPGNNGDCVTISSLNNTMATQNCSHRFPFICYEDNLVLVKENKTWEEALEYCRAFRYELLSVQPEDYSHVMSKVMEANTEEVWTGLHFLAGQWLWVNGADMLYSDLPRCPPTLERCGVISKNGAGRTETRDCAGRRNFMCYIK